MTFSQPRERTPVRADMSGRLFNPLTTKLRTSHVKGTQRCKNHRQVSSDTVRRRLKGHKQLLDSTMFEVLDVGHELPPLPMAESESTVDGLPNDVHDFEQIWQPHIERGCASFVGSGGGGASGGGGGGGAGGGFSGGAMRAGKVNNRSARVLHLQPLTLSPINISMEA